MNSLRVTEVTQKRAVIEAIINELHVVSGIVNHYGDKALEQLDARLETYEQMKEALDE